MSTFAKIVEKGSRSAGQCLYQVVSLVGLTPEERAALAWVIASAIMKSRCGSAASIYALWEDAALSGRVLTGTDRLKILAFSTAVFGQPQSKPNEDHVQGHVAEWLWYLLTTQRQEKQRTIQLLDPPKFSVTEGGGDGFIVWRDANSTHSFRLWELKKHVGQSHVSNTINTAYQQLSNHGARYLAQLVGTHSLKPGEVGRLCAALVDLWIEADERAGVGVAVTSATVPGPNRSFTTMGDMFPSFRSPGQLEGLLSTVEDFAEISSAVRKFVCAPL
ncbi:hypothetical protein ACQ7FX_00115 [Arthrobacter koreensis]|uniref:hypothetical protein n=1 Tax=Arthrobacter koreensis TaxID=199136 RepID=UPI003D94758A